MKWFKRKKQKEMDRSIGAQIAKGFEDGFKLGPTVTSQYYAESTPDTLRSIRKRIA